MLTCACTGGGDVADAGWVNVSVAETDTKLAVSFVAAPQQCDRQEVADCVIQRCRSVEPGLRVDGGVVDVTGAGLALELDSDPAQDAAPAPYAWTAVDDVADEGELLDFGVAGSRHVSAATASLRVPPRIRVPRCNGAPGNPTVIEAGQEIELDWSEGAEGHLLVRLVPEGGHEPEPHLKPGLAAICQYDAAAASASVAGRVSAALGSERIEMHVDLVSLALVETASERVALSITRDVCGTDIVD